MNLPRLGWRLDPLRLDCLVAVALTLLLELEVWFGTGARHEQEAVALLGPLVTGGVAVRRAYPLLAGVTAGAVVAIEAALWGVPQVISQAVAWICALYGLAAWARPRRFVLGVGVVAIASLVSSVGPRQTFAHGVTWALAPLVALLFVRSVVRDRERRAEVAERERDVAAREAVVEERARIAREVHDVIAHNVSMIAMQAGAERRVLGDAKSETREVLQTIEYAARGAMTEMRRLLEMLRGDAAEGLKPQPGLGDVAKLVMQVREAGLSVELDIDGERRALPAGIELAAYRIVQEALTNALKHAGESSAKVHIHYGADSLELQVVDDGAGPPPVASPGGHGLVGMRERVALYGGRFEAHRQDHGGFAVRAVLPVR